MNASNEQKNSNFEPKQKLYFAILVNITVPLAGMGTDIYLPSLPAISMHFNVAKALVQLTVTAYVIAMGFSQLLAGPISDAYGRRNLILAAIFTQFIAVLAILLAPSIYWIMLFRLIQGFGAAFMIVPARAIINDVFSGHALKKQFNYCTISFALGPIVAPFIGGYLQDYFGWKANFIFILIYCIFLGLLLLFTYRETLVAKRVFSIYHLWKNYHTILNNRYFLVNSLFVGFIWGYSALFNVIGPFLVQVALQYSAIAYGRVALTMGFAWFLGNSLSRILFRYDGKVKTQIALWLTFITTLVMFLLAQIGFFNLPTLALPTFIIITLSGFIFPIYIGECLSIFSDLAASANACLFGLFWIIFALFTVLAASLKAYSLSPLAITYITVSIFTLLFYYGLVARAK